MIKIRPSLKTKLILAAIIILGLILRLLFFKSVTFIYDQARDAVTSMEIWQGDPIKIAGPPTDIIGFNHGPLYWYIISPFYALSGGNVLLVKLFLIAINLIGIFFVYDLTQDLFKKRGISLLSAFLYAISFEAIAYGRWISNPGPALVTIAASFWALYKFIKGKKWAFIVLLASWGLSIQLEVFTVYQAIVFIGIWIALSGAKLPKIDRKTLLVSLGSLLFFLSTYIVAEIKFDFKGVKAFAEFFENQTHISSSFVNILSAFIHRLTGDFFVNIWGINLFLADFMTLVTVVFCINKIKSGPNKKQFLFLSIWAVSPIILNLFAAPNANFVFLGALVPIIIISSFLLFSFYTKSKILAILTLLVIVAGNMNLILSKNKEGDTLFAVQKQMILKDELSVIDWTYKEAGGKPFKLNTFTQPLFINSTWAFLYSWYGQSKYSYMPIWWGEKQVDVPGSKIKFADEAPTDLEFLIIEPGATGDDNFSKAIRMMENMRSKVIKTERIGYFTVEERLITKNVTYTSGDVFTLIKTTDIKTIQAVQ